MPQTLPCVKSALSRLSEKRPELSCNKHRQQIASLFTEAFFPQRTSLKPLEVENSVVVVHPAKLTLNVRNVNKRLKCRDEKIKKYESDIVAFPGKSSAAPPLNVHSKN